METSAWWLEYVFPDVRLPQSVEIRNRRLAVLYRLLQVCAACLFAGIIVVGDTYISIRKPGGALTVRGEWGEDYQEQARQDLIQPMCTTPARYDYVYNDQWKYLGHSCKELDPFGYFGTKSSTRVFVPTSFREQKAYSRPPSSAFGVDPCAGGEPCASGWRFRNVTGMAVCECQEDRSFFALGVKALRLNLEHFYELSSSSGDLLSRQHSGSSCRFGHWVCEDKGTGDELKTVFVVVRGSERTKLDPVFTSPEPIRISLGRLLDAAGVALDDFNTDTLSNRLRCGHPNANASACRYDVLDRPSLRITGIDIKVTLNYMNRRLFPSFPELEGHKGPACIAEVRVQPKWVGNPIIDCARVRSMSNVESDCTRTWYQGVSVSFSVSGGFAYVDFMQLLVTVGSTLAYFALPFWIVYFLAMFCMGPISDFYYSGVVTTLSADSAFCRLVCQAMTASAYFQALANERALLPMGRVLSDVNECFGRLEGFEASEQAALVELAYDRMCKGGGEEEQKVVGVKSFINNSLDEGLRVCLQRLFQLGRRVWPLERLLAPSDQLRPRRRRPRESAGLYDVRSPMAVLRDEVQVVEVGARVAAPASPSIPEVSPRMSRLRQAACAS